MPSPLALDDTPTGCLADNVPDELFVVHALMEMDNDDGESNHDTGTVETSLHPANSRQPHCARPICVDAFMSKPISVDAFMKDYSSSDDGDGDDDGDNSAFMAAPISVDAFMEDYSSSDDDDEDPYGKGNNGTGENNNSTTRESMLLSTESFLQNDSLSDPSGFDRHTWPRCCRRQTCHDHVCNSLGDCLLNHARTGHAKEAASMAARLSLTLNFYALMHADADDSNKKNKMAEPFLSKMSQGPVLPQPPTHFGRELKP